MSNQNADGQINLTITNGSTLTGLYAPDGSYNAVINDGTQLLGIRHPSGAFNVVVNATGTNAAQAPNGSLYIQTNTAGTGYTFTTSLGGVSKPPFDPSTTAWVNAVIAAGGTVSATRKAQVNALIVNLKKQYSTNYFTTSDRIWLLWGENTQQANIDIVNLATLTPHNAPTFTANKGYTGNATDMYLDTGFQGGTNYTGSNASFSAYDLTNRTAAQSGWYLMGADDGTNLAIYQALSGSTFGNALVNSTNQMFPLQTTAQGFALLTRTGTAGAVYINGSATPNNTMTFTGSTIPALNNFLLALNFEGSPIGFVSDQLGFVSYGAGRTATQASEFQGIINADATSVGANVY